MEPTDMTPASDEDRRLAEARKLTLQPLHPDITPEAPDAAENTDVVIDTAYMDIEQNTPLVKPSRGILGESDPGAVRKQRLLSFRVIITVILAVSLISAAAFLALYR